MADVATTSTATTTLPSLQLQQKNPSTCASDLVNATAKAEQVAAASESNYDLAKLPAAEALRLLSANLETLVRITGDVPPTPPPRTPTDPQMTDLQAEKDILTSATPSRSNTPPIGIRRKNLDGPDGENNSRTGSPRDMSRVKAYSAAMTQQIHAVQDQAIDGVRLKKTSTFGVPASSPRAAPTAAPALEPEAPIHADDSLPNAQHGAITRKFYSKLEPPISITGYLSRLHQFCPASAAVYLAASMYIHRLAVEERAIPVTRRNVHRLVLAALRVATKALEDLAYPHAKVAKVGGVSEAELARLEISFCFLAGFELVLGEEVLREHWEALKGEEALKMGMPTPEEKA